MRSLRVLALLGVVVGGWSTAAATPAAAQGTDGVCTDPDGVTVVVDFQELGGGVNVRCAAWSPGLTGFGALQGAGVNYQTAVRFPGFLCKIAGKPADDRCIDASPASAYWSYWLAPRGGQWCYSNWGAGSRLVPRGGIEAWSFSYRRTASTSPPPRLPVPAALAGAAPSPLAGNDCDARADAPKPTETCLLYTSPSPRDS